MMSRFLDGKPTMLDAFNWIRAIALAVAHLGTWNCPVVHSSELDSPKESASAIEHFETEIRPVLVQHCLQCHGATKQEGGLRLDSRNAILEGGDSGPAANVGRAELSLLIEAMRYESFEMPPAHPLPEKVVLEFERWLDNGMAWPNNAEPIRRTMQITEEDRRWWAFQPLAQVEPPENRNEWTHNPIDQFVLGRLHSQGMQPAPEASAETLIRRLYFDLIGMPPSLEEIDAFLEDEDPRAWERLVDRLLDDSRFGEHWGRHWLDLVRYSESDGWNQDAYRPHIWRYRDYVVQALNSDKPYPRFVLEQLAGDEIDEDNPNHFAAVGFLRLGIYEYNQRDARGLWNDIVNEMTDVAGDAFLGMSMACARCHDHKFDPVLQTDYFQLRAFFEPVIWRDDLVAATQEEKLEYAEKLATWEAATTDLRSEIERLLEPYNSRKWESTVDKFPLDIQACFHMPVEERTSWQHQMAYLVSRQFLEEGGGPLKNMSKEDKARHEELKKSLAAFDRLKPEALPPLMTATDFGGIRSPTRIPDRRDTVIAPGFLTVMQEHDYATQLTKTMLPLSDSAHRAKTSGRRTALARWIGDPNNPLTHRVMVNRIWQFHFGRGLVATPNDFGRQGQRPTHPELLDWLTAKFIADGWSMKKLHKSIVMSSTWKQSCEHPLAREYQSKDPHENLLWRANVRRLSAEQIRDSMLAISGELDSRIGGPSVETDVPRRSIYLKSFRNKNDTFLHGFDVANGLKSVAVRDTTTTPIQSLLLINGTYALARADALADRLTSIPFVDAADQLDTAIRMVWGRSPDSQEFERAMHFLDPTINEDGHTIAPETLIDFCHVLFNSNQFMYVE